MTREALETFRSLRARCDGISPSVLNTRLKELGDAQLVELGEDGYALTEQARKMMKAAGPLQVWAEQWGADFG